MWCLWSGARAPEFLMVSHNTPMLLVHRPVLRQQESKLGYLCHSHDPQHLLPCGLCLAVSLIITTIVITALASITNLVLDTMLRTLHVLSQLMPTTFL